MEKNRVLSHSINQANPAYLIHRQPKLSEQFKNNKQHTWAASGLACSMAIISWMAFLRTWLDLSLIRPTTSCRSPLCRGNGRAYNKQQLQQLFPSICSRYLTHSNTTATQSNINSDSTAHLAIYTSSTTYKSILHMSHFMFKTNNHVL